MSDTRDGSELSGLLFELSNPDRLALLSMMKKESLKLSQLAKKSHATVQETSRHLERLLAAKLLDKNVSGEFFLTSYGNLALELLPSLEFAVENKEYILDHNLAFLPPQLSRRLGDLVGAKYVNTVLGILRLTEQAISEASEYVWLMADQAFLPAQMEERIFSNKSEISWRIIVPQRAVDRPNQITSIPENFQFRFVDEPKAAIAMNEKRAGVAFSDLKGKLDMSAGFSGETKLFHDWCGDLFLYYWDGVPSQKQTQRFDY